ncbi:HERC4 ligase, partial [Trogon melanurus]|nr:HERC4 ligase [Trogon melanurus]
RKEFADLYVSYVFNELMQKPFNDLMEGFLRGCPTRNWKMFLPAELQIALQGYAEIDWHLWEKHVTYRWYDKLDQTIRSFWTMFHKLPEEKKKKFLLLCQNVIEFDSFGLECGAFHIEDPQTENLDERYPYTNTCDYILFFPG